MMRPSLTSLIVIPILVLAAATAHAGGKRFTTPLLSSASNEVFSCSIVNVDKKPVTAEVRFVADSGAVVTPTHTSCTVPIPPNAVCRVTAPVGTPTVYCDVVSSSAKVRVDLLLIDPLRPGHTAAVVVGTQK